MTDCGYFTQDEVNAIKWDPTGTLLASCSDDFTAKVNHCCWMVDAYILLENSSCQTCSCNIFGGTLCQINIFKGCFFH